MKANFFLYITIVSLFFQIKTETTGKISQNLWNSRAFSSYSSRELLMLKTMYGTESFRKERNGTFSVAQEYMQNFNISCNKSLGALPFWSGTNSMTYGGNDGLSDVDAYQFGIGDFVDQGQITLNPSVMHVGGDMLLHFTQNKHGYGFYFTLKAPLGAMKIHTKLTEKVAQHDEVANDATEDIWISYPTADTRFQTLSSAWQSGTTSGEVALIDSVLTKPITLQNGRFAPFPLTTINIGDIKISLGCNLHGCEKGFLSAGFNLSCPTGNVPVGKHILEPIFGRAGHWGIGGELTGHYKLWKNNQETMHLDIWTHGEVLNLRSGRKPSYRSFDLKQNGPGSKYLLVQLYHPTRPTATNLTGRTPSIVTNAIHFTTLPVISSFNVEGSASLLFDLHKESWNVAVGGEFWGRSKECLSIDKANVINGNHTNLNDLAVLGRQISEDARSITSSTSANRIFNLFLCEPLATINKSENRAQGVLQPLTVQPYPAQIAPVGYDASKIKDARFAQNRIPADLNEALDICGTEARSEISAKIFSQIGYTWHKKPYTPNFSLTGSVEVTPSSNKFELNLWSIGVQGSLNF